MKIKAQNHNSENGCQTRERVRRLFGGDYGGENRSKRNMEENEKLFKSGENGGEREREREEKLKVPQKKKF